MGETFRPSHVVVAGTEALPSPGGKVTLHLAIALAVFPVIFVGELPDKSMFASLVMASRGKPVAVWVGAAGGFLVHVAIATTVGVGLFALLPHRATDAIVAALFLAGAIYALREGFKDETELVEREVASHRRTVVTAFTVIFIAEWGDLTQILIANLAARYHAPLSVAIGSVLALWAVGGLAVMSGQGLLRYVPIRLIRYVTAAVLVVLAGLTAYSALR
jgi:putative Ca2+/H+ antiporter (TMEM165/GDT1 family)